MQLWLDTGELDTVIWQIEKRLQQLQLRVNNFVTHIHLIIAGA